LTAFGASFYFPQFKLVALGATYAGAFILYIYFISAKGKNNSTSRKIV
jgi:hypothetical protein